MISFYFMDVGQGDYTLVVDDAGDGWACIIDCGSSKSWAETVPIAIDSTKEILKELGIAFIDLLVITHPDSDHYNAIEDLLEELEIPLKHRIIYGGNSKEYKGTIALIEERKILKLIRSNNKGILQSSKQDVRMEIESRIDPTIDDTILLAITLGGMQVSLIGINNGSAYNRNDNSAVLCFEGTDSVNYFAPIIISGDCSEKVEDLVAIYFDTKRKGVQALAIKMGHHGSAHSTSTRYVEVLKPKLAFVTSDLRYGHPNDKAINRLTTLKNIKIAKMVQYRNIPYNGNMPDYRKADFVDLISDEHFIVSTAGSGKIYEVKSKKRAVFTNLMLYEAYNKYGKRIFYQANYSEITKQNVLGVGVSLHIDQGAAYIQYLAPEWTNAQERSRVCFSEIFDARTGDPRSDMIGIIDGVDNPLAQSKMVAEPPPIRRLRNGKVF